MESIDDVQYDFSKLILLHDSQLPLRRLSVVSFRDLITSTNCLR